MRKGMWVMREMRCRAMGKTAAKAGLGHGGPTKSLCDPVCGGWRTEMSHRHNLPGQRVGGREARGLGREQGGQLPPEHRLGALTCPFLGVQTQRSDQSPMWDPVDLTTCLAEGEGCMSQPRGDRQWPQETLTRLCCAGLYGGGEDTHPHVGAGSQLEVVQCVRLQVL